MVTTYPLTYSFNALGSLFLRSGRPISMAEPVSLLSLVAASVAARSTWMQVALLTLAWIYGWTLSSKLTRAEEHKLVGGHILNIPFIN